MPCRGWLVQPLPVAGHPHPPPAAPSLCVCVCAFSVVSLSLPAIGCRSNVDLIDFSVSYFADTFAAGPPTTDDVDADEDNGRRGGNGRKSKAHVYVMLPLFLSLSLSLFAGLQATCHLHLTSPFPRLAIIRFVSHLSASKKGNSSSSGRSPFCVSHDS